MKKVYIIQSGTLHPTTNQYWLTPRYHSTLKGAMHEFNQILEINKATDIETLIDFKPEKRSELKFYRGVLKQVDYIGEEAKYKARIILEQNELKVW